MSKTSQGQVNELLSIKVEQLWGNYGGDGYSIERWPHKGLPSLLNLNTTCE